jgi:carbon-monoxide dehydrogenase medium subunit
VKPPPFDYYAPTRLDEALGLLQEFGDDASLLAGGQSLVPLMNLRLATSPRLIDVNGLQETAGISATDERIRLGATVRARQVERSAVVARHLPLLAEAIGYIGHPQIRNRTTIGGNVAHADPASELPAVLALLDGVVELQSLSGVRRLGWEDFFVGPLMNARASAEMVVAVEFPVPDGFSFAFHEVATRAGDYALAGGCLGLRVEGRTVAGARAVLFGVGGLPLRLPGLEGLLTGESIDRFTAVQVREAVDEELPAVSGDGHGSARYRRALAGTVMARLLETHTERVR